MKKISLLNKDTGNKEDYLSRENVPRNASLDQRMICREIYNLMKEEITFTNMIFPNGPEKIVCKVDGHCFLPHAYYVATVKSGNPEIRVLENFGDQMFKGNKKPSRPEAKLK